MFTKNKSRLYLIFCLFLTQSCSGWVSCEQLNIDSYEIITGVDIPKVQDANCFSNDLTRITVFQIDFLAQEVKNHYRDLQDYAVAYRFQEISSNQFEPLDGFSLIEDWNFPLADNQTLFIKKGSSKKYDWNLILVPETSELIVEVKRT